MLDKPKLCCIIIPMKFNRAEISRSVIPERNGE